MRETQEISISLYIILANTHTSEIIVKTYANGKSRLFWKIQEFNEKFGKLIYFQWEVNKSIYHIIDGRNKLEY